MDLRQLRYFAQIVESGSLSKASRCLFVAQPALSQQIAKLEEEVGRPLLQRSSRGVIPTENGLALYHHARFMLRQLDHALSIARQDSAGVSGMVSVGLPATTVLAIGLPLTKCIRAKYPGILLNVVEGMSGHIAHMMRLGQLDLAILFNNDVSSKLDAIPLLDEELFVLLPADSSLVPQHRCSITVAEVAKLPLILPTGTHGLRRRVAAEFERRNITPNVVAEIDSLSLVMSCVGEGIGVTIKPMSALQAGGRSSEDWRALPISDARITRRNYVYSIKPDLLAPAALAVAKELQDTARTLVTSGQWRGVSLVNDSLSSAIPPAA
ncbi:MULTISPECIES: LysR substrate-binding domain-containing protein [unclassified Bradyrhizobium]|uniref:LysR substrate-binding domain-containing protein n=1 Tax=unclassified Bradyrhizobium TaxID=2631580 RepID=UPI0024E160CF|nr:MULTISPECIES: LysR substrate-binding domain-containing protein [unclassified Bradyrhizobium]